MYSLFVTGGVVFWLIVFVELLAIASLLDIDDPDKEGGFSLLAVFVLFVLLMYVPGDWKFRTAFNYVSAHWLRCFGYLVAYPFIGGVWSCWIVAWRARRRLADKYREEKLAFMTTYGIVGSVIPPEHAKAWQSKRKISQREIEACYAGITKHIAFWPASMIRFFVFNGFRMIAIWLRGPYEKIVRFALRDILKELDSSKPAGQQDELA